MSVSKTWNNSIRNIPQAGDVGWSDLTNFLTDLADNAQTTNKQLVAARTSTTASTVVTSTTDFYVGINYAGAAAVSLPAGINGQMFVIGDESNNASVNNITITPNGANTINGSATYVLNTNGQKIAITFNGGDWRVTSNFTTTSLTASSTTTFTNKSLVDSSTYIIDDVDGTKKLQFQASGISPGTTRTLNAPDRDGTIITSADTGTITSTMILDGTIVNADINASAAIAITKVANGTANQIIGANSGATANEYKSLATGTTGTDFAIAHSANIITFNIPDASTSNRGLITTSAQSIGGLKKFESGLADTGNVGANDSNVTFSNTDKRIQICTPTAARTYTLPTTNILAGDVWKFYNTSTTSANFITINASGGATVDYILPTGYLELVALINTPTTAAHWQVVNAHSDIITGWTPTFGSGFGTVSGVVATYYRNRDKIFIRTSFTTGTITAALQTISIPNSWTISSSKLTITGNTTSTIGDMVGRWATNASAASNAGCVVTAPGTSTSLVYFGAQLASATAQLVPLATGSNLSSSTGVVAEYQLPISGWN